MTITLHIACIIRHATLYIDAVESTNTFHEVFLMKKTGASGLSLFLGGESSTIPKQ